MNRNEIKFGIALGMLLPSLLFGIIFLMLSGGHNIQEAWGSMVHDQALMKVIALCCVVNLGLFYFFLNRNLYESTRGVILGTLMYGILGAIIIFFAG
jgi:hypothetical protein